MCLQTPNEIFARNSVLEVDNFGGGSLMMWGAISYARNTQMVPISGNLSAMRYRYEVLTPHMLPAMNLRRDVVDFLANLNLTVLPWPSKSPDLNTVEHLWDLDRRVRYSRLLSKNGENSARPFSSRLCLFVIYVY
jgi:hypothetical protein